VCLGPNTGIVSKATMLDHIPSCLKMVIFPQLEEENFVQGAVNERLLLDGEK
jgi:hypothetical protein